MYYLNLRFLKLMMQKSSYFVDFAATPSLHKHMEYSQTVILVSKYSFITLNILFLIV